ncbi:MAG: dual specificity protein phosphatase family protein [Candidatus Sumerlaeaceae bacterium]|nr:dual specificity protein phosphatase family protein [Candidatus Sumerlaeaceae bacterium]
MLHNFSFVIEGFLAGCAHPGSYGDPGEGLLELSEQGISSVVSLDEFGLPAYLVAEHGMRHLHLPIPDFETPTAGQARQFVDFLRREHAENRAVAVHCRAGMGRTGTMLAIYLVAEGEEPNRAISIVRRKRPGSIETMEQEQFIIDFARDLESSRNKQPRKHQK